MTNTAICNGMFYTVLLKNNNTGGGAIQISTYNFKSTFTFSKIVQLTLESNALVIKYTISDTIINSDTLNTIVLDISIGFPSSDLNKIYAFIIDNTIKI